MICRYVAAKLVQRSRKIFMKRINNPINQDSDKFYGSNAERPDLPMDLYMDLKKHHYNELESWATQADIIEKNTILQSNCNLWHEKRKKLITASNFGIICRAKKSERALSTLKKSFNIRSRAIEYGKANENSSIRQLELQENIDIEPCGILIDYQNSCLGAPPDGIVRNENMIFEVKCPYSGKNLSTNSEEFRKKKLNI